MNPEFLPSGGAPHRPAGRDEARERELPELVELARGLLDQVLDQFDEGKPSDDSDREDLEALQAVARSYAGQSFRVDPILTELIEVILVRQFSQGVAREGWRSLARSAAETMFEDPASHARIDRLWCQLSRMA